MVASRVPRLESLKDLAHAVTPDERPQLLAIVVRLYGTGGKYERHKQEAAARSRAQSTTGREIGPLPAVADPARREACEHDLELYLPTYFPNAFTKRFSVDQRRCIQKLQTAVLERCLQAIALPRGSGKTTICERAALWALSYGYHFFAMLIQAKEEKARDVLQRVIFELEHNPRLGADFPELCYPIRCLEGIHNRAKGQTLNGERTLMKFQRHKVVLPTVPGSPSSGAILSAHGLLSAVRGAQHLLADGTIVRPTLLLPDDPQTRETARSSEQTDTLEQILCGDLLGCGPPGERVSALMPCTVIEKGDLADRTLDPKKHPEWRGERRKLLISPPSDLDAWDPYYDILRADLNDPECGTPYARATQYYLDHPEMKTGAEASWPERHAPDEADAIQHAMNLKFLVGERAYAAEYDNQPMSLAELDDDPLTVDSICERINSCARLQVPLGCSWIVSFIDVHQRALYWKLLAVEPDFTNYVIDYGVFPEQNRPHFTVARARPTLQEKFRGAGKDGAIYQGLLKLFKTFDQKEFVREDGTAMKLSRGLVDCGYNSSIVRKAIRESKSPTWLPSFGRTCGPNEVPISAYTQKPGEMISSEEWLLRGGTRKRKQGLHVIFDTYHWKTVAARRLSTVVGDPGAATLYGGVGPRHHEFLAEHFTSEQKAPQIGRRQVDVWTAIPGKTENHWWDCYVGCLVAASICGARLIAGRPAFVPVVERKPLEHQPKPPDDERVQYL